MAEPAWKSLVEQLKDREKEGPYLKRLRASLHMQTGQASLEQEILSEMAGALGRAGDKVNYALLRLELAEEQWSDAPPAQRRARAEAFNAIREEAEHAKWELRVHREALGLYRNRILDEDYPIPPRKPLS